MNKYEDQWLYKDIKVLYTIKTNKEVFDTLKEIFDLIDHKLSS